MEITKIQIDSITYSSACLPNGLRHIKSLPFLSIVQAVDGSYSIGINGGPVSNTGKGGFFIAPSAVTQEIIHCAQDSQSYVNVRWVFIDVVVNAGYRLDLLYDFALILPDSLKSAMNDAFNALFAGQTIYDKMIVGYQIVKLIMSVAVPKKIQTNDAVLNVLNLIREQYSQRLTVDDMAQAAHMSKSHFFEIFKANLGASPLAYLNHYRLTQASVLLTCSSLPISRIAGAVGFEDQLYFSRMFRKDYGVSPKKYRDLSAQSK